MISPTAPSPAIAPNLSGEARLGETRLSRLLRPVFEQFESRRIRYAVLRNAEGLPQSTRHDVDLLVAPECLSEAMRIIRKVAAQQSWDILTELDKFHYHCLYLSDPEVGHAFLPIDLVTGLTYRCHAFANADTGLDLRRQNDQGIWVVPEGFESSTTLVKELLAKGRIKENSRASIQRGARRDADSFMAALRNRMPSDLTDQLCRAAREGDWDKAEKLSTKLKASVCRLRGSRGKDYLSYLTKTAAHYLRPPLSCFLVVIGPDGSGKSSLTQALGERMLQKPFKVVRHFKSNFGILPPLKRLKNAGRRLLGKAPLPHTEPTEGEWHSGMIQSNPWWASMIYVAYYALDLMLGRLWLRRLRGQCALILFDRYYYDYYYQIGNRRAPRWVLRWFERLIPKPDLVIELDRDPEEIFAKKPELCVEEIRLEQKIIRQLLAGRKSARTVNAREGLICTSDRVTQMILEKVWQESSMTPKSQ